MNNDVVKELNHFLEGNFMAIHAYENYIQRINNPNLKEIFQTLQQGHKEHALKVAERIQNLGGVPIDDVGIKGTMVEMIKKITGQANDVETILKDALVGENRGIDKSREMLDGELDPESLELVKQILNHDEKHVALLSELIHKRTYH